MIDAPTAITPNDELSIQLYSLASIGLFSDRLDEAKLKQAKSLLERGANPNYTPKPLNTMTLGESTVFSNDLPFLKLLKEYGANMESSSLSSNYELQDYNALDNQLDRKKFLLKGKRLPLQKAISKLKDDYFNPDLHEICKILYAQSSVLTDVKLADFIEQKITSLYRTLLVKIKIELEQAIAENKRLMILVGEEHETLNSAMIEVLIATLCAHHFGFKTFFTEHNLAMYRHLEKYGRRLARGNAWGTSVTTYQFIRQSIKGEIIPIDLGHYGAQKLPSGEYEDLSCSKNNFDNRSEKGCQYRNSVMNEVADQMAKGHVVAFLGAAHLAGMLNDTFLKKNFHVMTINATGRTKEAYEFSKDQSTAQSYEDKCTEFLFSTEVFSVNITPQNSTSESVLTPTMAIELINKVHQAEINNHCQQNTMSTPSVTSEQSSSLPSSHNTPPVIFTYPTVMSPQPQSAATKRKREEDETLSEEQENKKQKVDKTNWWPCNLL